MSRSLVLLIALALLPLAGCINPGDEPVDTASTDASQTPDMADAKMTDPEAGDDADPEMLGETTETPIDWSGATGDNICVPSGPYSCTGTSMGRDAFKEIDAAGMTEGELTLSWEPTTPQSDTLDFYIWVATSCGDSCYESSGEKFEYMRGTPPLVMPFDFILEEGEMLVMSVNVPSAPIPGAVPVYGRASLDQPFHVEGLVYSTA